MNESPAIKAQDSSTLSEADVIDYLSQHNDLLERHPTVLAQLTFAHDSGAAVSLVERQLKILREENRELKDRLAELVTIARENEELSQRFHRMSLELMSINNLHDLLAMIREQIQTFFYTDHVSFLFNDHLQGKLTGLEKHTLDPQEPQADQFRSWMKSRSPIIDQLDPQLSQRLFGDKTEPASTVLIPLIHTEKIGLLVLGSHSKERFQQGMGTHFLNQLADLVSNRLAYLIR